MYMRRFRNIASVFILFTLLVCLLAGCGAAPAPETQPATEPPCPHQWSEADCLNGSSCALCGETQAEPLGHTWAAASCENPEQCTRCGETKGDALGHSFGEWMLGSDQMHRTCVYCEQAESRELDYAFYLDQRIYGHWNLHSVIRDGQTRYANDIPSAQVDSEVWFREDGSVVSRTFTEKELSKGWRFDRAEYVSDQAQHILYITDPNSAAFSDSHFLYTGDQLFYVTPDSNGNTLILSKDHGEAMTPLITGTWSAWFDGGLYNITLAEDRTFTADFDGGISGYWLPRMPEGNPYSSSKTGTITLNYIKNGKEQTLHTSLLGYNEGSSSADSFNLSLSVNGSYASFALNAAQALTEALTTADSAHLGTWTSTEYSTYSYTFSASEGYQESSEGPKSSNAYSITFLEDGTFQANLHKELTGKWELQSIEARYKQIDLKYRMIVPGLDESSHFQFSSSGNAYLSLSKNVMSPRSYESASYTLQRLTEEDIAAQQALVDAAPSLLTGEWFHTGMEGYSCIFHEDGTFTAQSGTGDLQTETKGNWYFSSLNVYDDYTYYFYDLETVLDMDGAEGTEGTEPQTFREDRCLILLVRNGLYELESRSMFLSGVFTNAETMARNQEVASNIIGHWHADTAAKYDSRTQQSRDVQGSFSLDIAEDGTFTSHILQDIRGTYSYFDTVDGEVRYLFSFPDSDQIDSLFTLKDGVLRGYIDSLVVTFTR